jgi:hypothetical protein
MLFDWDEPSAFVAPIIDWEAGYAIYTPPSVAGSTVASLPVMVYAGEADSEIGKVAGSPRSTYTGDADF